ncbi:MAG: EAL domain-containing protein [Acetobacteraceae bacterium]
MANEEMSEGKLEGLRAAPQPKEERFLRFAFAAADLLLEVAAEGTIRYATGAFAVRLGVRAEEFVGRDVSSLIVPADHGLLASALVRAAACGRAAPVVVHLNNAGREPVSLAALANEEGAGRLSVTLGRLPEPLTPAVETLVGVDVFRREAMARLTAGGGGALSLLEVAGQGGSGGDLASSAAAAELAGWIAEAGPQAGIHRRALFGTLAPGRFGMISDAPIDLERLCAWVEALWRESGGRVKVTAAGLALTQNGAGVADVARALRLALCSFGHGGLKRLSEAGFARGLSGFLEEAAERREAIRSVIFARRFELAFQPVVNLADRAVRHYEALLRLSAQADMCPPSTQEFVIAAEAAGLAEELDAAVVEQALDVLAEVPQAAVAVNVSGFSFQSEAFRHWLIDVLNSRRGRRGRLLVELTETAEIDDIAAARETLATIRAADIPICLDDFGAGAAAFRYLREFRADYVKIDGGFLRAARASGREKAILGAMVGLARDVGAKVVVEMIESAEEEALSRALGADFGQGWLYGKPGRLPGSALRHIPAGRRRANTPIRNPA